MKTWIISDTHFGHQNMISYCGRPANFDEIIIKNLKEKIPWQTDDVLIHLGDFCIGKDEKWHKEFFDSIPKSVKKVLVLGNHDKKSKTWYLRNGWDFVCDSFSTHHEGKYITFSHIPIVGIQNINVHGHFHNNLPRLLQRKFISEIEEKRNEQGFGLKNYNPKLHKLFALEDRKYRPILLEDLLTYLEKK